MLEVSLPIQPYYANDFSMCYGCGTRNTNGHHFETRWQGITTVTEYMPLPYHTAIPGFVYGGLLASLVDCHSTGSAALAFYRQQGHEPGDSMPVPRFVTASLKVDYVKPTPLGIVLRVVGNIQAISAKKVIVSSKVFAQDLMVATSEVVAVLAPPSMLGHTAGSSD